jgi:hypothetical protein
MSTTQPPSGTAPDSPGGVVSTADAVAGLRAGVARLGDVLWAAKPAGELLDATMELERLRSTLAAVQAQVAAEIDATDAQKDQQWASAGDYLTAIAGGRSGHGQRLLHIARAVTGDLAMTGTALMDGDLSPEHAEVIVRAIDKLPVDTELRVTAEKWLVEHAGRLNATELRKAAGHLLEVLDPEGTEKREEKKLAAHERSAHLNRFLAISHDGLGGVRVRGRGTTEDAAVIQAALAPLSGPEPNTDPDCGREGRDPRDHGTRSWDALVQACQRLQDAEVLPTDHGIKPRLTITLDYDALEQGVGNGTLDTGQTLSGAAVRKLACDAELIPAVLGSRGEILDLGQARRLVTAAIWVALVLRDRHCTFPGCHRPPIACDAHHIRHWADGGPTSLDNLALLCRTHHTILHNTAWQIRTNPIDRRPEFKPPPGRHHRLAHRHRIDQCYHHDDQGWVRKRIPRE